MYQRQPLTEKRGSDDDDDAFKDELDMHAKKITSILFGMLLLRVNSGYEFQIGHSSWSKRDLKISLEYPDFQMNQQKLATFLEDQVFQELE